VNARACLLATALTCAVAVGACGGSTSTTAAKTAEAHLVKFAKTVCAEIREGNKTEPDDAALKTQAKRLVALMFAAHKAPRVARLISDSDARQRVRSAMPKLAGKNPNRAFLVHAGVHSLFKEYYRLEVKVYADEKAVGISCIGRPPRKPIGG